MAIKKTHTHTHTHTRWREENNSVVKAGAPLQLKALQSRASRRHSSRSGSSVRITENRRERTDVNTGSQRRGNVSRRLLWHVNAIVSGSWWKGTERKRERERKSGGRLDETTQSRRQICRPIRDAIIRYYGKARSLCYPAIETGNTRGNLMTHQLRCFFLAAESLSLCASRHFSIFGPENPDWPL